MKDKGSQSLEFNRFVSKVRPSRGLLFGALILGALLAFEIFNFSTTEFALTDLLGDLRFAGLRWAAILAIAFCGIDFAGIARLFTPEKGSGEPKEVWYLFGAWLLAATMNAMLTYWGVTIALLSHSSLGDTMVSQATLIKVVPVFVAIMVWLIRVLIIGTFSVAGDRLFSQSDAPRLSRQSPRLSPPQPVANPGSMPVQAASFTPPARQESQTALTTNQRPEPSYHAVSMSSAPHQSHR